MLSATSTTSGGLLQIIGFLPPALGLLAGAFAIIRGVDMVRRARDYAHLSPIDVHEGKPGPRAVQLAKTWGVLSVAIGVMLPVVIVLGKLGYLTTPASREQPVSSDGGGFVEPLLFIIAFSASGVALGTAMIRKAEWFARINSLSWRLYRHDEERPVPRSEVVKMEIGGWITLIAALLIGVTLVLLVLGWV
jgi:hypothetical protein